MPVARIAAQRLAALGQEGVRRRAEAAAAGGGQGGGGAGGIALRDRDPSPAATKRRAAAAAARASDKGTLARDPSPISREGWPGRRNLKVHTPDSGPGLRRSR